MSRIAHSTDLWIKGEMSWQRAECQSSVTLFNSASNTSEIWFVPFESDGNTIFDRYICNISFVPNHPSSDQYAYKFAVYRQYAKLGDTATTNGVGELVANSTFSSGTLTGSTTVTTTTALASPVNLPQGSYWIAFHPYLVNVPSGALTVTSADGINCFSAGLTWVNESHLYGVVASVGTLPSIMTTSGGTMSSLGATFASVDSCWLGVFDSRSV